jgi:16S rRNA (guanine527-N7)-methyltransferase
LMSSVSRETPAPPASAREYFGARLPIAERYAQLLAGPGTERGLLGPREVGRLWERHLLNCAVVHEAVPAGGTVADVGSGAGLPGLVLALLRTDLQVTLVEPMLRRVTFLNEAVKTLGLSNVAVVRARAEELHGRLAVDRVTARAVAPLARLARWTLPLLRPGGMLVALRGSSVVAEVESAGKELATLGAVSWVVRSYGEGVVDPPTRVALVEVGRVVRQP